MPGDVTALAVADSDERWELPCLSARLRPLRAWQPQGGSGLGGGHRDDMAGGEPARRPGRACGRPGGGLRRRVAVGRAELRERFAFHGRVPTEDWQDPESSRARQREQADALVRGTGAWWLSSSTRGRAGSGRGGGRPQAAALVAALADPDCGYGPVVIGEYERAFYSRNVAANGETRVYQGNLTVQPGCSELDDLLAGNLPHQPCLSRAESAFGAILATWPGRCANSRPRQLCHT